MRCLRCGYCCRNHAVIIVDGPEKGIQEDNLVFQPGNGVTCKHLRGDKPGEYACAVHNEPWYKETPCFSHGQIERSKDDPCRMGEFVLKNYAMGKVM